MAQSINLIPQQEVREQTKSKVVKTSTVLSILLLIIVSGASFYFFTETQAMENKKEQLDKDIEKLRSDINDLADIEIIARNLDKKYNALINLFDNKVYYSDLMRELDRRTPEGIKVSTFTLRGKNEINISGTAQNYLLVSDFTNALLLEQVEDSPTIDPFPTVTLNSVSLNSKDSTVSFAMTLELNTGAFQR